jgi:hypothetical protein
MLLDRKGFERLPECLALALAVSLPWSTSATGILAVLWLLAVDTDDRSPIVAADRL